MKIDVTGRGLLFLFLIFFVIYVVARYAGLFFGLSQASRMEFVREIVRMSQIVPTWMFAVGPRYAPDMCMYVCLAFLFVFYCVTTATVRVHKCESSWHYILTTSSINFNQTKK